MFASIGGLLDYWPVFRDFHYQILQEMYDDNVMYIELRTGMGSLLDEGGRKIESRELAEKMIEINENFKNTHPGFLGFKVIIAINRNSKPAKFESKLKLFLDLKKEFPDLVVGFDLVGQEDTGMPLSKYVSRLQEISSNGRYFFHAGETNFYGSETDLNLIDAILMNATRIGHGYSLMKHPVLWNAVKARDIAIEIAPISNQVLHLVEDLRNHPAAFYISENVPIVICADDPGFWDAKALSYDMYFAFMAFTPQNAGLRVLKQLAWNSLKYSGMSVAEKQNASAEFKKSWDKFIDDALNNNLD
jgi:adenosine deaminase CECR1